MWKFEFFNTIRLIEASKTVVCYVRNTSILLKNSEIEPSRKSRFRARCVISADSPHGRASRSVARGKAGRSAEPPGNFSSRPPAVFRIVIDTEIRVFQHNLRIAAVHGVGFE
jgi:hypothetical protein